MPRLEVVCEQPAHRDIGNGGKPLGSRSCSHVSKGLTSLFGKRRAAISEHQPARNAGMPDDRFERERGDFFERVRKVYLERASAEPGRIAIVDAGGSIEQVGAGVLDQLKARSWIS